MEALFASGRIVDAIIGLILAEGVALAFLLSRRPGRPRILPGLLANLAAGGALLLALRLALVGAGWIGIGAALGLAFIAHLADLALRWRGSA